MVEESSQEYERNEVTNDLGHVDVHAQDGYHDDNDDDERQDPLLNSQIENNDIEIAK